MTTSNESPTREVRSTTTSVLGPKTMLRVGAWNVRTMYATSKTAQVIDEMRRYRIDIMGISECRWTGSGRLTTNDGSTVLYSGQQETHSQGVAIIISKAKTKSLIEWEPINERFIRARFDSKYCKLTIIQCYAPTNEADTELKEDWYEQLQVLVSKVPQHDMLLVTGDFNAKVGSSNSHFEKAMGAHGCGDMNENGGYLADFCMNNRLVIGGTIFPHKAIHKLTWTSPDGVTTNQIDHIMINGKWRRSLEDVRVYRGADANSDHFLVSASIKLKLRKAAVKSQQKKRFDIPKLKTPQIKTAFVLELKNRFRVLAEEEVVEEEEEVSQKWKNIKNVYNNTAERVLGFRKRKNKEWLTPRTWRLIEERRDLKVKLLGTKSLRLQERAKAAYKDKDKEVKRSARNDKRAHIDNLACEAEQAAVRGDWGTVYKVTKQLSGAHNNSSAPVKDKDGNILSSDHEQATRWVQHFREVLNHPDPSEPANPTPSDAILDINTDPPTVAEIKRAILAMKNGKAAGIDSIHAEMMKADADLAAFVLTDLFSSIWEKGKIPDDWSKGLIVKLPKKGNLQECDNWRGITLLSIPSKIFCRVLLKRIDQAIDTRLRQEQAGFRKGRGCIDQIFVLRNIIEQSLEWNTPTYINFVDFRKAFDSVHRDTLWKILMSYGVPHKIIAMISLFYDHFECSVIMENSLTDWFPVESGVRQGCILSPILFLVTIDWIMRRTTADKARGIQWTLFSQLEDLDFADDLALLAAQHSHLQEKTDRLGSFAASTGLAISTTKTQVMYVNPRVTTPITSSGKPLETVNDFTYLGSVISSDNGAQKDMKARLGKAQSAFARLRTIWKSRQYSLHTKIRLYNSNVKSVLLYGSECWRVVKSDMSRVEAFHNRCLRKICHIFWPSKISNHDLYARTGSQSIIDEIKRRRFRWLGHVLRMEEERIPKIALRWTPPGKRKRGRPKTTWRRTVMAELTEKGITWGQAQHIARDRDRWRELTEALCPSRDEED